MKDFLMQCFFLFVFWVRVTSAVAASTSRSSLSEQKLFPITVRSRLQARGVPDFTPKINCEHHYADYSKILRGLPSRFAKTATRFYWPTISLEDIELHAEEIQCRDGNIFVRFSSSNVYEQAMENWQGHDKLLVISSHAGCSKEGERTPHLASHISYNANNLSASFTTRTLRWTDTYDHMTVNFGMAKYHSSSVRLHDNLRKRAPASSTIAVAGTAALSASLPLITVTPSGNSSNTSTTLELGLSVPKGQQMFPLPGMPDPSNGNLAVTCQSCFLNGFINLESGSFLISSTSSPSAQKTVSFLDNGFLETSVTGMHGSIELGILLFGKTATSFNTSLGGPFPLTPFFIPGVGSVTPTFNPVLTASIAGDARANFSYGFELTVPNNSSMLLALNPTHASSTSGFTQTQISQKPLISTDASLNNTLTLGLHAALGFSVTLDDGGGAAAVQAFLDLPRLETVIATVDGDAQCNAGNATRNVFAGLVNVVGKAVVDVGFEAPTGGSTSMLAQTTTVLPTACLSFDAARGAYGVPGATAMATVEVVGTGSEKGSTNANGTGTVIAMFEGTGTRGLRGIGWWMGCIGGVFWGMVLL